MSYNEFATRENVTYRALVCEQLREDAFIVDLLDADDGLPVAEDGLNLNFDEPVKSGDIIYLKRTGDRFEMRREDD